jgi:hypothetical protein
MKHYDHDPFILDAPAAPAVLGEERAAVDEKEAVVFLPSAKVSRPEGDVTFQVYRSDADEILLPAFTSLEALVNVFGESQPWVCVPGDRVEPIRQACGAAHVIWEPAPTED